MLNALRLMLIAALVACALSAAPEAEAQCYPGLPCADAPAAPAQPEPQDAPPAANRAQAPADAPAEEPAAEPGPEAQTCYVDDVRPPDDWLALRTEPSSRAGRQIRRLRKGQQFELTGDFRGQWYQVRLPDGVVGWVSWQVSRWIAC